MKEIKKEVIIRNLDGSVAHHLITVNAVESMDDALSEYSEDQIVQLINDSRVFSRSLKYRMILRNERKHSEMFTHWPAFGVLTSNDRLYHSVSSLSPVDIKRAIEAFSFKRK